ncbi:MAG: 30S ribosomal protein S5, partial [Methanobacteriota archaeon]
MKGRKRRQRKQRREEFNIDLWQPRTNVGRDVKEGRITEISQILRTGKPIKEREIVSALLPNIQEEILEVNLVQRMHKSGRRVKYRVVVVVGNRDGIFG